MTVASAIYGSIDVIAKRIEEEQQNAFAEEVHQTEIAEQSVIVFSAIYLILLIFILIGIQRFILKPVNNILNMTENLNQGDGDLTQRLTIKGKNEISAVAHGFNTFIASTDDMVSQVTKSVSRLIPMSQELLSSNTEIETASMRQSDHSRAVGESIVQTRDSANEVLAYIQQITNSVKNNIGELDDGQQVAHKTIKGMDQLANEIKQVSDAVIKLSEDSTKIESIIDVINAISEQTNLLALNAAIEASTCGRIRTRVCRCCR
ncbi:methyl-accepting chemotaxis protein [Psychromonas sp. KJ10-10]|uniref:methyl-accepting chemotaxis protein n=1 Tax=Psychromonas sp. KJ10-10 TaxID=3391823 RepID=UPI0039B41DAD